jgi:hypothetical protein
MEYIKRSSAHSAARKIDSQESKFTLGFSSHGCLIFDISAKVCKMNSQHLRDAVLEETKRVMTVMTRQSGIEGTMIQMENCKVHNSAKTIERLDEFQVTRVPHPPYSPDILPCDF